MAILFLGTNTHAMTGVRNHKYLWGSSIFWRNPERIQLCFHKKCWENMTVLHIRPLRRAELTASFPPTPAPSCSPGSITCISALTGPCHTWWAGPTGAEESSVRTVPLQHSYLDCVQTPTLWQHFPENLLLWRSRRAHLWSVSSEGQML